MPIPIRLNGRRLNFEPALVVVEIFFRRDKNFARPDHRFLDDGNGGLERSDGLPVGILVLRRPYAFLTHRTDHAERLP